MLPEEYFLMPRCADNLGDVITTVNYGRLKMPKQWKQLTVKFEPELYDKIMELSTKESMGNPKRISMGEWIRRAVIEKMEDIEQSHFLERYSV
jgi:hypothetical protein